MTKSKLAVLIALVSFQLAASAGSSVRYSDAAITFVKQFPIDVLSACNLWDLMCRGLPMAVVSASSENRYGEEQTYRKIEGAGLIISHDNYDADSIEITDSSVILPMGIRVGDTVADVYKALGPGDETVGDGSHRMEYKDESTLSNVSFYFLKDRIHRVRWEVYRD